MNFQVWENLYIPKPALEICKSKSLIFQSFDSTFTVEKRMYNMSICFLILGNEN